MAIANGKWVSFCNQPKAHFGLPGYIPRSIAVNGTCMKREFNACQTHCSIYPSIFNHLRAIARYWSEIATFPYPLVFNAPIGVFPLELRENFGPQKTESCDYQAVKSVWRWVEPFWHNISVWWTDVVWLTHVKMNKYFTVVTDRRADGGTDRQTELLYQYRPSVCWRTALLSI